VKTSNFIYAYLLIYDSSFEENALDVYVVVVLVEK
jgi:hypothetical protein